MKVGFTGTRQGMTALQKAVVTGLLIEEKSEIAHHGGCIGADIDFDNICWAFKPRSILTVVHPSDIKSKQGKWHYSPWVLPEKPPLDRNRDIVDHSDFLIAAPKESKEIVRSGTWATIRYARKVGKPVSIVYPDGSIRRQQND